MNEGEILDLLRQGLWLSFIVSAPILVSTLVIGLIVGLFQALTSIQEMTLTFVPKLATILVVFWMSMAFSGRAIVSFYQDTIVTKIAGG